MTDDEAGCGRRPAARNLGELLERAVRGDDAACELLVERAVHDARARCVLDVVLEVRFAAGERVEGLAPSLESAAWWETSVRAAIRKHEQRDV